MTAVAARGLQAPGPTPAPARRSLVRVPAWVWIPTLIATANAIAFFVLRPGVNDLWAARARASAVSHGVGLTYWFSWFGGGSTPGNYSVLSPWLSALTSAEFVGAVSAVAITLLTAAAVKDTRHPAAATGVATVCVALNLWSGRVPFLLGCVFALVALIAVIHRNSVVTVLATVLAVLSSPVSAAFLALGLAGTVLRDRTHRVPAAIAIGTVVIGFGAVAVAFGTPGPQEFAVGVFLQVAGGLVLFMFAKPPVELRVVLWLSALALVLVVLIPNGMGSNFTRMVWFCLPVAVVALSGRSAWVASLLVVPMLISGGNLTVSDLRDATARVADTSYYAPLAKELDNIPGLSNFRLEVVAETAHAAYDALLDHAMLARGWETQEDNALNRSLRQAALDATTYKVWLDNNSVGYVALPRAQNASYPEYTLVAGKQPPYLTRIWSSTDWMLYRVSDSRPIVAAPNAIIEYSQAKLTVRARCACTFSVRIRYSKYLRGSSLPGGVTATFANDSYGYTLMTTPMPGDYILHGSVRSLFR